MLVDYGWNPITSAKYLMIVHKALSSKQFSVFEYLLQFITPDLLSALCEEYGETLLHCACKMTLVK